MSGSPTVEAPDAAGVQAPGHVPVALCGGEATDFVAGVFDDMPAARYHLIEAMSASGAKRMLQSPAHYRLMRDEPREPTAAMQLGTVIHAGVLEPDTFGAVVAQAPDVDRHTKLGKEELAAFAVANAGKVILPAVDFARARRCIDAVLAHPAASRLLAGAEVEKSFFWTDGRYKVPCKARWDARNHGLAIDLKSTIDASPEGFARQIASLRYHVQAAHYCSAAEHLLDESPQGFVFIAVESEPPHAVACYALPGNAILVGTHLMSIALERYAAALAAGAWRGYPDTIEAIALPKYALRFT
ncbi:MAG: PD-(D/E)XK nuclease-like domain-containing protein [Burkholderiales bacterium]